MQTWISIGGFDFSNPGPTHTTFSDIVHRPSNRAKLIASLLQFMRQWDFEGVDINWEYPSQRSRGGRPSDAANLVALVHEMRAEFGTKYGISVALPPDFTHLSGYDPSGMAPYVDFFNFMAYDIHGPWEAETEVGAYIRPHTSILDIDSALLPLWFDGVPPSKINFGIAYYGRGYTLTSRSCTGIGCRYVAGNRPGGCTTSSGVLSSREIDVIIAEKGLVPRLVPDLMIKEVTWDDQWIGYDDNETVALKTRWGNRHCLGGMSIWSVDLGSGVGRCVGLFSRVE